LDHQLHRTLPDKQFFSWAENQFDIVEDNSSKYKQIGRDWGISRLSIWLKLGVCSGAGSKE